MATVDLGLSFGVAFHTATANPKGTDLSDALLWRGDQKHLVGPAGVPGTTAAAGPSQDSTKPHNTHTRAIAKAPEPRGLFLGALALGLLRGSAPARP